MVVSALVKDQFGRAALGIGHEGDLCVDDFQEEVAVAFREDLHYRLAGRLRRKDGRLLV